MTKWRRILYHPNLPLGENGKRVTACAEHIALSKNAAKEGMVLLKNNGGILPFAKGTKIALFGKGTFDYVKGGGGSGDVTVEYTVNLYEGLKKMEDRVSIFEKLADFYRDYVARQYKAGNQPGLIAEPALSETFHESEDYVDYTEDIYVGYRYFETLPGTAARVNYPFGYGLSYPIPKGFCLCETLCTE